MDIFREQQPPRSSPGREAIKLNKQRREHGALSDLLRGGHHAAGETPTSSSFLPATALDAQ
jgi:hypothetical protein